MLIPKTSKWAVLQNGIQMFSEYFMTEGREENPMEQEREEL